LKKFESPIPELEGIECWSARDLQLLLSYSKWEEFWEIVEFQKLKILLQNALVKIINNHFS